MARTRGHVYVSGRVQGVMFRESARREAVARGITGWIRNLADGRVEAVFEGEEEAVRALVAWCNRGPSRARVDHVEVEWEAMAGEFDRFEVEDGWSW